MIRRVRLTAVAAVLFVLLAAEWLLPAASAPAFRQPPTTPAAASQAEAATNIVAWQNTILARPVFNPDRRPAPLADTAVDDTLPRLSAIIVTGSTRSAIFATGDAKPVMVSEGGQVGAYRIKSVAADSVDLLGPDGLVTVRPQFISSAGTAQASQ